MLSNANDNSEHRAHGGSLKSFIKTAFGPGNRSLEFLCRLLQFVISIVQASLPSETIMLITKITLCLKVQLRDCAAQRELGNLFWHFEARSQCSPGRQPGALPATGRGGSQGPSGRCWAPSSPERAVPLLGRDSGGLGCENWAKQGPRPAAVAAAGWGPAAAPLGAGSGPRRRPCCDGHQPA